IRYKPWTAPGEAGVTFLPKTIEHAEPGGVNWLTRKSLPLSKSASRRHPSLLQNSLARFTSETGTTITSSFVAALATLAYLVASLLRTLAGAAEDSVASLGLA